jgi:dTDP-4-amino-4,6-dideoxygalactose transaminase
MGDDAGMNSHDGEDTHRFIPYGRQWIDEEDIRAVIDILRSDWLTTGPMVEAFENSVRTYTGAAHAVAVSSGTAALHAVMHALDIRPGDEVIVPAITFAATANAVVYQGGTPVFADVDKDTLLMDAESVKNRITDRTRAVVAVDYAGQLCDYDALRKILSPKGIVLVSDSCHALGGTYRKLAAGNVADMTVFSFHPVKTVTTGEGGMITTGNGRLAEE